jgi:hypothetical protein
MKEKIIIIGVILCGFIIFSKIKESRAEENLTNEFTITHHLYERAIAEIKNGNRDRGCKILHQAFAHSYEVDDNWKTYNHIWTIGTAACNWTLRPDTMETVDTN